MREIILDTETTGLDPYTGDRVIEIGCVEILNGVKSGNVFHCYINPERDVPEGAVAVHGITSDFLKDKPRFCEVADDFLAFVAGAPIVAHNAAFDFGFLNAELERLPRPLLAREQLVDTLLLARRKFPGAPCRLDDLCLRFGIDASRRTKHGALLDAELLAEVYIELTGSRQANLGLEAIEQVLADAGAGAVIRVRPRPLAPRITPEDIAAHGAFVATLGPNALWGRYVPAEAQPLVAAG